MARANLSFCLERIFAHEGGFADHRADPGGATNMGITRKTLARWRGVSPWWALSKGVVKALKRREAAAIYKALYWAPVAGNKLPAGVDLALFDFAVNSGPARAIKALQRELKVRADGAVGPITLGALRARVEDAGAGALIAAICARRLGFLERLRTFAVFGRGWTRRVESVERAALELAGAETQSISQKGRSLMDILSGYKTYIAGVLMLLAGVGQVFGVDVPGFDTQSAGQLIVEGLAIVFLRKGVKTDIGNA